MPWEEPMLRQQDLPSNAYAGGLVGSIDGGAGSTIENSYTVSPIQAIHQGDILGNGGGLIGELTAGVVLVGENYFADGALGTNGIGIGMPCANPTCQLLSGDDIKNLDEPASNLSWDASIWNAGSGSFPCLNAISFGRGGCSDGGAPPNATEPGTPGLMLANGGVARQLIATWNAPPHNFALIDEYQLQYREDGDMNWTDAVGPINSPYTITGLMGGTTYNVQVRAINRIGAGPWGTQNGVAIGAPQAPSLMALGRGGSGELIATWTAPANNGGSAITGYNVDWGAGSMMVGPGASPYTITGLTDGTSYDVTVSAINAIGRELHQTQEVKLQQQLPEHQTYLVIWSVPINNGGLAITGYLVDWGAGNMTVAAGASPYAITGLINGTSYDVTVSAINAIGTGTASNTRSQTTATTPDAPIITSAYKRTPCTDGTTVEWTEGPDNGGFPVTHYEVEFRTESVPNTMSYNGWTGQGTVLSAAELIKTQVSSSCSSHKRQFRMRAHSMIGNSPWVVSMGI